MGRKALVTGGDSGIGRAAVIAFAREGADVAINYLPVEEPDAQEVVELIRAEGRKAVAIPAISGTRIFAPGSSPTPHGIWMDWTSLSQRGHGGGAALDRGSHDRAVRLDIQMRRLCDVLDHEGRHAAP